MRYEEPEMEIVIFKEYDVITASIMTDEGHGGSGDENDDDTVDFGGGFH